MQKFIVTAALLAASITGTKAADAVVQEPVAVFSWTGAYVGLNIGLGGGEMKHTDPNFGGSVINASSNGFLGGVQVGYNYQIDQWVVGAEADFQGASIKGEGQIVPGVNLGTKLDWYGTVRARAGMLATDSLLIYATGGLAYGHTKTYLDVPGDDISSSKTKAGWTAGAGAEYALTDRISLKTEYACTDLGTAPVFDDVMLGAGLEREVNFHSVKFGINYKF